VINNIQKLYRDLIPAFIQILVSSLLVVIALVCGGVTINEIMVIYKMIIKFNMNVNQVDIFFLHISNAILAIEFMLLVIKYFHEHFHFPLRYVIYIGITSIVRHIIVSHEHLIKGSIATLLLVIAYCLVCIKNYKIGKEKYN